MKGFFGGIEANKNCRRYLLTFKISHLGLAGGKLALKKAAGVGLAKAKLGLVGGKIALVKAKKAAPLVVAGKLGAAGLGAAGLGAAGLGMYLPFFRSCSILFQSIYNLIVVDLTRFKQFIRGHSTTTWTEF